MAWRYHHEVVQVHPAHLFASQMPEARLAEFDAKGWELVSVTALNAAGGITAGLLYVFRAPVD